MSWTIINSGRYGEPIQQALEEVLVERVNSGDIGPTLRFWYRRQPAIALGRFQAYADEVETGYVADADIDVVRRITGGGAMYVEPGDVITYSLYLPRADVPENIPDSYAELDQWTIDTLGDLGVEAFHEPLNDIAHADGKIGGSAQLRKDSAVLHHTTMSYSLDIPEMLRALRIGEEKLSDKAIESAEKRVTKIADHVEASRADVIDAMVSRAENRFEAELRELRSDELASARQLAENKFRTGEWNMRL